MEEIYTMIMNHGVTTVIAVIFLWQYVVNAKKLNETNKPKQEEKDNDTIYALLIDKLDEILFLLKNIYKE